MLDNDDKLVHASIEYLASITIGKRWRHDPKYGDFPFGRSGSVLGLGLAGEQSDDTKNS